MIGPRDGTGWSFQPAGRLLRTDLSGVTLVGDLRAAEAEESATVHFDRVSLHRCRDVAELRRTVAREARQKRVGRERRKPRLGEGQPSIAVA